MLPLRIMLVLNLLLLSLTPAHNFVLDSIELDEATFQSCTYCDERSDRAGSRAAANALREYMTRNHIKIVVDEDDVKLEKRLPNEAINTGHSCKYRAEARNVVGRVLMIPETVNLSPEGVVYYDEIRNSFAVADVGHALNVEYDVRVRGGIKFFGSCKQIWRKTCHTDGYSEGTNRISVNLAASNVLVECIGGQEHLTMNVDAIVSDEAKHRTYKPVKVGKKNNCDLNVFGIKIGSINSKIQDYANRYLKGNERVRQLRGKDIIAELQKKLKFRLGSKVTLPITSSRRPRQCPSQYGRSASRCTKRKSCPPSYTRIGNQDKCQKYMGTTRPNCNLKGSKVYSKKFGSRNLYWCHAPMV